MAGKFEKNLEALGIKFLPPKPAAGSYVPFVCVGSLVYISGQLPLQEDGKLVQGRLGVEVELEEGQAAARLCAIQIVAQLQSACRGDLARVKRCVRLGGFVNAAPEFTKHPLVINGASDLIVKVFGDAGYHARAAVGVSSLPLNVAVEVDAIFELHSAS